MKKKGFVYRVRLFGLRFYVSTVRLKRMNPSMARRSGKISEAISAYKNRHYRLNGGMCDVCGRKVDRDEIQLHHVLPFYEFPQYGTNPRNMEIVCPDCHHSLHLDPYVNLKRMEQKAREFGFDLAEYYHNSSFASKGLANQSSGAD